MVIIVSKNISTILFCRFCRNAHISIAAFSFKLFAKTFEFLVSYFEGSS